MEGYQQIHDVLRYSIKPDARVADHAINTKYTYLS